MKLLLAVILLTGPAWAQCTSPCVAHTAIQGSTDQTTVAIDSTGGRQVVIVLNYAVIAPVIVPDSLGNGYTQRLITGPNAAYFTAIYTCTSLPCIVGSGHTFSYTCSANCYASMFVAVFSGTGTFDQNAANDTCSTAIMCQPGSISPTATGNLVVTGLFYSDTGSTATVNSGFNVTDVLPYMAGGTFVSGGGLAWITAAAATSYNPTWSWVNAESANTVIASFLTPVISSVPTITLILQ